MQPSHHGGSINASEGPTGKGGVQGADSWKPSPEAFVVVVEAAVILRSLASGPGVRQRSAETERFI